MKSKEAALLAAAQLAAATGVISGTNAATITKEILKRLWQERLIEDDAIPEAILRDWSRP